LGVCDHFLLNILKIRLIESLRNRCFAALQGNGVYIQRAQKYPERATPIFEILNILFDYHYPIATGKSYFGE
jgi:hypothetical protein